MAPTAITIAAENFMVELKTLEQHGCAEKVSMDGMHHFMVAK